MMDAPGSRPARLVPVGGDGVAERASATTLVTAVEREHGDALLGFVCRLGIDAATGEDVVQEALLRLYDAIAGGKRVDDPRAWLFTVGYRLAMDDHRRRERASRLDSQSRGPADPPSADPVRVSEQRMVWAEVDRLPDRQRHVLYLRYSADLPFEAIGRVLGITSSAARSHATQAMSALRMRLVTEDAR